MALYKTLIHPEARKDALHKIFETFCAPEIAGRIQGTSALLDINDRAHLKSATQTQSVDALSKLSSNNIVDIHSTNHEDGCSSTATITNFIPNDASKIKESEVLSNISEHQQTEQEKAESITNFTPNTSDNININKLSNNSAVSTNSIVNDSDNNNINNNRVEINIVPSEKEQIQIKSPLEIEQQITTQISPNNTIQNSNNSENTNNMINSNTMSDSLNTSSSINVTSITDSSISAPSPFFSENSNAIGCYGKSLKRLKRRMNLGECTTDIFDEVVGEILNDLKLDVFPRFLESKMFDMYLRCKLMENNKIGIESFHFMRMLGRGAFGSVNACKKKDTGKLYAMKQIDKRRVQATDSIHSLIAERDFLSLMDSRFVTSLKYAFMDQDKLYFIMDLMTGGDLKYHLNHDGYFEENRSRYYCAQILLGLEHIHGKGIIYRDLKLENVLVDERGNIKISDLGLAVSTKDGLVRGYAGTPGYTAPEVVLTQYYDQQVDFFSFGVVIYRSICGKKPFARKKTNEMRINEMDRIRKASIELDRNVVEMLPPYESVRFTPKIKNLCRGLLSKNPKHRLGINGYNEIKEHPWFDCIDWGLLEAGYLSSPFIPACDEIHAEQQQCIGRPPDDDKYAKIKVSTEFNQSLREFEFKSAKVIQAEIVQVLERIDSERGTNDASDGSLSYNELYTFPTAPEVITTKKHCLSCVII